MLAAHPSGRAAGLRPTHQCGSSLGACSSSGGGASTSYAMISPASRGHLSQAKQQRDPGANHGCLAGRPACRTLGLHSAHPGLHLHGRHVGCRSQVRHFNTEFDPSRSSIPAEYQFSPPLICNPLLAPSKPASDDDTDAQPESTPKEYIEVTNKQQYLPKAYWSSKLAPQGAFTVPNSYSQHTRLTPLAVPGTHPGVLGILGGSVEYYGVEMEINYAKEWPQFVWQDGTFKFRPGFLSPAVDPDLPGYMFTRTVAAFKFTALDRALQYAVAAVYVAALGALAALLYTVQPMLLATVVVSWSRKTLSLAKWAALLALAAVDRIWLYWVFLAGKIVDQVLERHMPGVRNFMWANFLLWCIYLALAPRTRPLIPFL